MLSHSYVNLFGSGATLNDAQGFLLAQPSGITPGGALGLLYCSGIALGVLGTMGAGDQTLISYN